MAVKNGQASVLMNSLSSRFNIVLAVILRDIRTRFGRSYLGYLIAIGWPLTHIVGLVVLMGALRNSAPVIGTDNAVFIATGVVPYVLCLYPARLMGYSIENNRALFVFPIVRALDIILSRAIIEFLTAFTVVTLFFLGATIGGIDLVPIDVVGGATAVLGTVYFAISVGILNTIICSIIRFWHIVFIVLMMIAYLTAGIFVIPSTLSEGARQIVWYNPLLHCVEWLRSAYYEGYGDNMLSRSYLMWFATTCLALGLLGERFVRGKLLSQ